MSFLLRPQDSREFKYPDAQDINFLGFDRKADRWKVDASGIHLYASGISVDLDKDNDSVAVWSASGTSDIPVYITSPVEVDVRIDDTIKILSASGTPDVPVYIQNEVRATDLDIRGISKTEDNISIWSASGTPDIPVYITSPVEVVVDIGDEIKILSSSGTPDIPVYLESNLDYNNDSVTARVNSASGTHVIPTYIEGGHVDIDLNESTDSIRIYSASGAAGMETWINDEVAVFHAEPLYYPLIKKRIIYNANGDPEEIRIASVATPSGQPCVVKNITYNASDDPDYVIESYGTW